MGAGPDFPASSTTTLVASGSPGGLSKCGNRASAAKTGGGTAQFGLRRRSRAIRADRVQLDEGPNEGLTSKLRRMSRASDSVSGSRVSSLGDVSERAFSAAGSGCLLGRPGASSAMAVSAWSSERAPGCRRLSMTGLGSRGTSRPGAGGRSDSVLAVVADWPRDCPRRVPSGEAMKSNLGSRSSPSVSTAVRLAR